ncbi:uncharacterized protein [Littorina saxatilis]|uniref:Uncharacterized protein n=1 Tax=Littorina saxatilis TaxID=31220 RepID=A0AAN9BGU6_9CAEN
METFKREQPGEAPKRNEHSLMMKPHSHFSPEVDSHPSAPMIITAQPVQQRRQGETAPSTNCTLVMSIWSTTCCICFGGAAILCTLMASKEIRDGQYSKARRTLKQTWALIALTIVTGSVLIVVYMLDKFDVIEYDDTDYGIFKANLRINN